MRMKNILILFALCFIGSSLCESCEKKDEEKERTIPTVETRDIKNVTGHTANVCGMVIDNGGAFILSEGVCYSETAHQFMPIGFVGSGGHGESEFEIELDNLDPHTTYYVKAFALNSEGYGYGEEKTLHTWLKDDGSSFKHWTKP